MALIAVSIAPSALAAPGRLDPSWNGTGKVVHRGGGLSFEAVTTDAQGRVLVAGMGNSGQLIVKRFEKDGALDKTFGADGTFTSSSRKSSIHAWGIETDSQGRIVVATFQRDSAVRVWRLTALGQLDTTFHSQGYKGFQWQGCCQVVPSNFPVRLAIDGRDRPVVAGTEYSAHGEDVKYGVARLTVHGNLDRSFDGDGMVLGDVGIPEGVGLALDSHGRIVLAGAFLSKLPGEQGSRFFVTKLNTDGSVDTAFAHDGLLIGAFRKKKQHPNSIGVDLALDQGRIVVAGLESARHPHGQFDFDFALARYRADGTRDRSFGSGGRVVVPLTHGGKHLRANLQALAVDSKGRYLLAGFNGYGDYRHPSALSLARVNHGGKPDRSFGAHGQVDLKLFHHGKKEHDEGLDVIADGRDRPLVVGNSSPPPSPFYKLSFVLRFKG